jgi:Ca-activated chloride channel homolog
MLNPRPTLASLCVLIAALGCNARQSPQPSVAARAPVGQAQTHSESAGEALMAEEAPVTGGDVQPEAPKTLARTPQPVEHSMARPSVALDDAEAEPTTSAARKDLSRAAGSEAAKRKTPVATPGAGVALAQGAPAQPSPIASSPDKGFIAPSDTPNTESYSHVADNPFLAVADQPLSTFSIDVDTASYSNLRRMLNEGQTVPEGAVRIEELVNYFSYDYPNPTGNAPFSVNSEVAQAPWNTKHQLVRIGLQGKRIATKELPPRNLVFLIDVSGSMADANKLPLLTRSLTALTETLNEHDHVSMVVYAGASGVVLEPTPGNQKQVIRDALTRLEAGGSTNGASGIELAYRTAARHFQAGGVNRVILATDGDFNVGPSSESELVRIIEDKRKSGVYLTVLGFGMGNYKDSNLEQLADHGNGNYAYIDSFEEAHKVLVEEGGSTLVTIAKDVKIQVEFNPRFVGAYRLLGYENRKLENRDFHDDRKDAGEIGAGHNVTALYEVVPPAAANGLTKAEALKYQAPRAMQGGKGELLTVKLRYKMPQEENSTLLSVPVVAPGVVDKGTDDFRFAAAVAAFGMVLRNSEHRGQANLDLVHNLAQGALGADRTGRRKELLELVRQARKVVPALAPTAVSVAR